MNGFDRSPSLARFQGFQLDLRAGELRPITGKTLRLSQQPFRILKMLIENPGQVVTREDIRKELWPDDTIVEFEHSIDAAMRRLRLALGDSADQPHYIETLARRGYRWMVSVDWMDVGPTSNVTPRRWWRWTAALVAVLGFAGILWILHPAQKNPEPGLTVTPLTASPEPESDPSFSPDGNQVAFVRPERSQSESHIYVKLIGTDGPPLRLTTGPVLDYSPAWSPDGRYIAFLRDLSEEKAAVLLIPALGGPEHKIAEVFQSRFLPCTYLTWSSYGNSLVVSDRDTPKEPTGLFLLAIDTGEKRRLTSPSSAAAWDRSGDACPSLSPDGQTLAFSRTVDVKADLYLLAVSDGFRGMDEPRRIKVGNLRAYAPVWTENGREIVFWDGDYPPRAALWRIDVSGSEGRSSEPQRLAALGENAFEAAISRRGHRLAYSSSFSRSSIWRIAAPIDPRAHTVTSDGPANRATQFIYSTRNDRAPEFSRDGKRIAFMSSRSGNWEIWVCGSDGSNPVQLTSFRGPSVTNPRWSPDGKRIAFDNDAEGEPDVWVIDSNGGQPKRMTSHPANDGNPSWSEDGRWIYFDSARTGEQQVWKIPEAGGDAIQVTRDGGLAPLESPDGKFIYFGKTMGASVWRLPTGGGEATKLIENVSDPENVVIATKGIYFVSQQGTASDASIQFLDFATNRTKRLASFGKPFGSGLALSPDGRWILYTESDRTSSELRLVENFR